ncbi:lipopolysaccharide assembly protein LapA domain-containing protein [Williamsia sp. 1135]|uniref:lipopolysaccharide assembly protein LapA domain-containing protein n=1 Tax=Williamsia sp. 1135 TaxID=1889262 RepID=UPI000A0F617E|nr:lipopolysaccharide assembly protein LapA domain-containing protein [Williamsia sp. 1135]ORM37666.1 hypothetical protein BFL43_03625 [Williamsia sp. 1135]
MTNPTPINETGTDTTTTTTAPNKGRRVSTIIGLIIAAVLVVAFIVFVTQNTEQVQIEFFGLNLDLAQGVALLLAAVVGFLIAVLGAGVLRLRSKVRRRRS